MGMNVRVSPPRLEDEVVLNAYLGQRIRLARIALGVSQQALAEKLGLTFQQIQKYERGRNRISASRLYDIARALGIGVGVFYKGLEEGVRGPLPQSMNDLTEAYERLSPQFGARELVELNQAFVRIPSGETRLKIIQLAELIAASQDEIGSETAVIPPAADADVRADNDPAGRAKNQAVKFAVA